MENRAEHLLESYFANALTAAEANELTALASADPSVAAELAFQRRVSASIQSHSLSDGIEQKDWRSAALKSDPSAAIKVSMLPRYAYAAAAAIALLIVANIFIKPPSLQTIVADNTKEYPNKMSFRSMGYTPENVPERVLNAFALYDEKKFEEAASAFQPIVEEDAAQLDYRFYWGVSLVKSKQYTAAVSVLTPIVQSEYEGKVPANFYLGLACAGAGDRICARQNLQKYIDSPQGVTYRKQAQKVLEAL